MKMLRRCLSLFLTTSLVLGLAACGGPSSSKPVDSSSDDTVSWREPAEIVTEERFVDTDGDFEYKFVDWASPEGYTIIVPTGDTQARKSANTLKNFISSKYSVDLSIKTDAASPSEKEILIGKTKRSESNKDLEEGQLEVSIKDKKLVFDGGHPITVNSAVEKFVRLAPEKGKAATFNLKTDFAATALDGYKYVWGDEFEGTDVDFTKWDFEARMQGTASIELSWDKDTINVEDGRLKLVSHRYFNPKNESTQYRVPYSTLTKYKMNYVYGYAEIRCRMPFFSGSWPSFWAVSGFIKDGKYDATAQSDWDYGIEIDIFEAFGKDTILSPAMHRWYKAENYDYDSKHETAAGNHTSFGGKDTTFPAWDWAEHGSQATKIDQEYHIYGFEWTKKEIAMYVDGEKYATYDLSKSWDEYNDMSHFHDPIHLIFNNHLMANDSSLKETVIDQDKTKLPGEYFIDWIRVYQKPGVGKIYIDETPKTYEGR